MKKRGFVFYTTKLEGLRIIEPLFDPDERGFFSKSFEKNIFKENGININVCETFESQSIKGVVRGLHFQHNHWQDKLIRCISGEIFDVAVDLRNDSPTYGMWEAVFLSASNRKLFYIPKGFAHGVMALEDNSIHCYMCGDVYDPKSDGGIIWNDPDIAIEWPLERVDNKIVLSEKDKKFPRLKDIDVKYK